MTEKVLSVVVTGAAGQISYSLLPLLCSGKVFGEDCFIDLRLFDIPPAMDSLEGVKMELQDSTFSLLQQLTITTDLKVAFSDVDVAILVGGFPRKQGMLRKDLISKNVGIFKAQGQALEQYASNDTKVLVVANPANTNCLIAMENAPKLPRSNFTCLTRLDHERLRGLLVEKLNALNCSSKILCAKDIRYCIIWGNHSSTQVPDCRFAQVFLNNEWKKVEKVIDDKEWSRVQLVSQVQQRGAAVIKARKLSSAMSAAQAIAKHLYNWYKGGTDDFVSMGIDSSSISEQVSGYSIPSGLIYSFPVKCLGNWEIEPVLNLEIDASTEKLMQASATELISEKQDAMEILQVSNL